MGKDKKQAASQSDYMGFILLIEVESQDSESQWDGGSIRTYLCSISKYYTYIVIDNKKRFKNLNHLTV